MNIKRIPTSTESIANGDVFVASRDLLPGQLVVKEKRPLLYFTQSFLQRFDNYDPDFRMAMASFNTFITNLSPEHKEKFLSLYKPNTETDAVKIRKYVQRVKVHSDNDTDTRELTPEEVEMFVKVATITRLHFFAVGADKKLAIFGDVSRFPHSCDANCVYTFEGKTCSCYTNRFIKAGEELTISCIEGMDAEPVYVRRHRYLDAKGFTCHCPRCDALGDDTRQFDCSDPNCRGVMLAFQPISKGDDRAAPLQYSGVKFADPHLLPCTYCHRAAPPAYEAKMLLLEARIPDLVQSYTERFDSLLVAGRHFEMELLLHEIAQIKFPLRHAAAFPLLCLEMQISHALYLNQGPTKSALVQKAALKYIAVHDTLFPHPNKTVCAALAVMGEICSTACQPPIFAPAEERELCQKALRMHLLLHGRSSRVVALEEIVLSSLSKLPPARTTELCAFCGESPLCAALALYRCGKCRQVAYCSAGCQKAHWKLHKKTCKAIVEK